MEKLLRLFSKLNTYNQQKIIIFLLLILSSVSARTIENFSMYFKPEIARESNIFESNEENIYDYNLQLWGGAKYSKSTEKSAFELYWLENYIAYQNYSIENKLTSSLTAQYFYYISPSIFTSSYINIFAKHWLKDRWGYTNLELSGNFGFTNLNLITLFGLSYRDNNYSKYPYDLLNSNQVGVNIEFIRSSTPRSKTSLRLEYIYVNYPDLLIFQERYSPNPQNIHQKDQIILLQIGKELKRKMIAGANLRIFYTSSNSKYSSYWGSSLNLYITRKFFNTAIQLVGEIQLKRYIEDLSEHLIFYNPDPEQNMQNQLLFGWERPIFQKLFFTGKIAFMRNETQYSGIYYDKWFLTAGFQYKLE